MTRIFLHGLGQTPASWEKTVAALMPVEHNVCPDLAGILQGKPSSYEGLYSAFAKTCDGLDGTVDLCGLSLGGVLALHYTIEYPEKVNSLVLIAAPYKMPVGLLRLQDLLFHFMPKAMFRQTGFGKNEFIQLCKTMMKLDFSNSIQKIRCPTLVICGEKDSANKKAAIKLASLLEGSQLQMISGAGHEVNKEAPEKLAEMLRGFYKQVDGTLR